MTDPKKQISSQDNGRGYWSGEVPLLLTMFSARRLSRHAQATLWQFWRIYTYNTKV